MTTRRSILQGMVGGLAASALWPPRLSFARLAGDRRLVVVILRGGLDGLAAVPAHGDPDYAALRAGLALGPPGEEGGVLDLDGFFGLHPALRVFHEMFGEGEVLAIQAVAVPYHGRSHFDAQEVLENGTAQPGGARDGWLNRALQRLDPRSEGGLGLALGEAVPLLLRGAAPVASWAPNLLPLPDPTLMERILDLWQRDPLLGPALAEAVRLQGTAAPDLEQVGGGRLRGLYSPRGFAVLAETAGRMLAESDGPRLAVMEMEGWDTHANQGRLNGRLAIQLDALGKGVMVLRERLGPAWRRTVVTVVSEFGRTASPNGTGGSDHGVGGVAFLLGGAVSGGRVIADWPGLKPRQLYEGRDLRPTTDLRAVLKAVLRDHLGLDGRSLSAAVFPDSGGVKPLANLLRS